MTGFDPRVEPLGVAVLVPHRDYLEFARSLAPVGGVYAGGLKRGFETLLILAAAPVVLPLILLLALMIAVESGKPFYVQKRVGRGGKAFRLWKLRTMVVDADDRLEAHLAADPAARAEWERTQKLKADPRVTCIGRLLRKTSLDELPQLLNVLNGTMALVGPRPMMVNQQMMYDGLAYYRLRPGITGPWQISARNGSEFVARVRYDDQYAASVSLRTDLRIIARTMVVLPRCTGY
ncbi:sugar transferase [Paracoccus sp. MC1854]|uniref:sugar transferase n=1 Tax=Paracoccus sp. MC1854 TaxID=2760306 RepID=UPI002107B099|nr:sugar transferase [Paracoccus sp. MC1854]